MAESKLNLSLRVDRTFDLNEFVKITGADSKTQFKRQAKGISLDTRTIKEGDVFFAIQSSRDGHEFVNQAIQKGAIACVVSRDVDSKEKILVSDTLQCLWNYAGWVRKTWGRKIIALSGSNGKTSTKEMLGTLLGEKTLKTPGTWNNFLGVPLTLLMLQKEHECGVIEMGINHFGELLQLCKFVSPNVALLTNVGPAHLENLHDLDGVAKAKGEIFCQLQPQGTAVLNMDDPRIANMKSTIRSQIITVSQKGPADISLVSKKRSDRGYDLVIRYGDQEIQTSLALHGEHNISNYLCALGGVMAMGVSAKEAKERTPTIQVVQMRMQTFSLDGDRTLINDCYNANPGSFQAALQTVSEMKSKRLIVFMGDMLEMGSHAGRIHRDFGKLFQEYGVDHLFVTGEFAKDVALGASDGGLKKDQITIIEKKSDAAEKILPKFQSGDILLVKASRGMKLEEVVDVIHDRLKG